MISNKEVKRTFKVVLDSFDTNSYTAPLVGGELNQFNANYIIDLQRLISDDSAFDKPYNVYCSFITRADSIANNDINLGFVYALSLNFNNSASQIYQFDRRNNFNFTLPIENIYDTAVPPASHTLLKLDDNNQRPLFLQNIRNLTNISLQVYKNNSAGENIFVPSTPNNSKYICILTFVEA